FFIFGLLPLLFIIAFCGLELAISLIQAQVFVVLTASYIKDALDLHGDSGSGPSIGSSNRGIEKSNLYSEGRIKFNPNQQRTYSSCSRRRLFLSSAILSSKRKLSPVNAETLDPNYISGFIDAEGCFYVKISRNDKVKVKWYVY